MRAPGRRDRRCKLPSARGCGNPFATKPLKPPINHPDRRRNGADLLRHYFPKGVDLTSLSQAKLNSVAR